MDSGFTKIHLEADSALLVHWISNNSKPPRTLQMHIQKLKDLCQHCEEFRCSHVYKEANFPADSLSKLSHDLQQIKHYNTVLDLASHIRGNVILDQLDTPAFRHKLTNIIQQSSDNASTSSSSNAYV